MNKQLIRTIWVVLSIALAIGSFKGGDTSIICGWLWLIWTIPFGVIWQFCIYNLLIKFLQPQIVQYAGCVLVILTFYLFWFIAFPAIRKIKKT